MAVFVLALSVAAPFLLWPVEIFLPYPHLLEEVLKLVLVLMILKKSGSFSGQIGLGLASGALFAFSESVLYFLGIFQIGQPVLFFQRLALTIPLHTGTTLLILLFGLKKKEFVLVGFLLAVALHYGYNQAIKESFSGWLH